MRDLAGYAETRPGVTVFDFTGGRIAAMNDMIMEEMRAGAPTPAARYGNDILNRRATDCLFERNPLPPGLAGLAARLYPALAVYLGRHRPDLVGLPYRHRSWCNHFKPNEGLPWHDHRGTPVVAVYSVKGPGGDLIIQDPDMSRRCHRVETPPGRLIFMPGALRHCSTPNFGPVETRVSLPVNFSFGLNERP